MLSEYYLANMSFRVAENQNYLSGQTTYPGPRLNIKTIFPGMGIPMLKIEQSFL